MFSTGCAAAGAPAQTGSSPAPEATVSEAQAEGTYAKEDWITLKLFVDETWWYYDTWQGRIPDIVGDKFGIKCDVTIPSDTNQLNMMIASGDLGDLVCTGKFNRMCDPNICYTLDELAEEYGMDLNIGSVMRFVNTADDGKLYTQMVGFSPNYIMKDWDKSVYENAGMVIRTDIYDELGRPPIENLDQFEDLLQMVKDNYPDMVPYAFNPSFTNDFIKILCGATHEDTGFIERDGKVIPVMMDPKLEEYFTRMNRWYNKGFFTDENFAWTGAEAEDLLVAGQLFCDCYYSNSGDVYNAQIKEAGSDFSIEQVIDITTSQPGAELTVGSPGWRGMFIPKSCKDPKRVLEFMLWAWSDEGQETLLWGEEGKDWKWDEDHSYPMLNYDFENPDATAGMKYWGWMCHDGKTNAIVNYGGGGTTYPARVALTKIAVVNPVLGMLRMGPDSNEQVIMDGLAELYKNESTNILTAPNEEECRSRYASFIQTCYDMGAQQLIDWANEKYPKMKEAYDAIKDNED